MATTYSGPMCPICKSEEGWTVKIRFGSEWKSCVECPYEDKVKPEDNLTPIEPDPA